MASLSSSTAEEATTLQPKPTSNLSLAEAGTVIEATKPTSNYIPAVKPQRKRSKLRRRIRTVLRKLGSTLYDVFVAFSLLIIYGIPGTIFVAVVIGLMLGISFGFHAANAAVALLIGNAILRAAHLAHYTDNAMAAAIGAVGSPVALLIVGVFSQILPNDQNGQIWWPFQLFVYTAVMALTGTLGAKFLQHGHVDLRGTDVLHATRAGALGGAILGPGSIVAGPIILLGLGILLSPLFIAMKLGFRWVYVRSSETWDDRGHYRYSHCVTYGTCGDDSDIEEELQQLPQHLRP